VLFGGAIMGLFGGLYYWWPKIFGYMLSERLGKLNFWLVFVGMNVTFGPMHWLGLQGMPRRIYTYSDKLGLNLWNVVASIGAFVIAFSTLVFMYNVVRSWRRNVPAGDDPWDARNPEWACPNPPPPWNFDEIPTIRAVDDFWHRKYTEDENGYLVRLEPVVLPASAVGRETAGGSDGHGDGHSDGHAEGGAEGEERAEAERATPHLPTPSYYPLLAAIGLPIMGYGMVFGRDHGQYYLFTVLGALVLLTGLYAWGLEPSTEPEEPEPVAPAEVPEPAMVGSGDRALEAGTAEEDDDERIPRGLLTGGQEPDEGGGG